jgi:hypothetical protein
LSPGQFTGNPQGETLPGVRCCPKNEVAGKWGLKWLFFKTGEIYGLLLYHFIFIMALYHCQENEIPLPVSSV